MTHRHDTPDLSQIYSYQASILHARAYRNLKQHKNAILKRHGLSMMQWMVLGLINDAKGGVRISDIAEQLDTTQAFATTTVNILEARDFVTRTADEKDKRAKFVKIKPDHRRLVNEIELDVRQKLRESLYAGVTRDELTAFMKVLAVFSEDEKGVLK